MPKDYTYVNLDMPGVDEVIADMGLNQTGDVQQYLTHRAKERMERHVPLRDGNLRAEAQENFDEVIYGPPGSESEAYARRTYFLPQEGTQWTTPGTGSHWDVRMMADQGEQLAKDVQDYVDKRK